MSSFGKAVAEVLRDVRKDFAGKKTVGATPIDPQVREQINAEFDKIIDKHDVIKPTPGTI